MEALRTRWVQRNDAVQSFKRFNSNAYRLQVNGIPVCLDSDCQMGNISENLVPYLYPFTFGLLLVSDSIVRCCIKSVRRMKILSCTLLVIMRLSLSSIILGTALKTTICKVVLVILTFETSTEVNSDFLSRGKSQEMGDRNAETKPIQVRPKHEEISTQIPQQEHTLHDNIMVDEIPEYQLGDGESSDLLSRRQIRALNFKSYASVRCHHHEMSHFPSCGSSYC